jgi:hypothetical protein
MIFSKNETIDTKLGIFKKSVKKYKVGVDVQLIKSPNEKKLYKFLMPNCLVGNCDNVPGIEEIPIGINMDSAQFNKIQTIWAHQLKIDNLEKIDSLFQKYLKVSVEKTGYKAYIA